MKHILPVFFLFLLFGSPCCVRAQPSWKPGPFVAVPAPDPAWQCYDELRKAGIDLFGDEGADLRKRVPKPTRYEFAAAIARRLPFLKPADPASFVKSNTPPPLEDVEAFEAKFQHNTRTAESLLALLNEFQPELLKLGQNVLGAKQRLFEVSPFADVPDNDESYQALNALQDIGLVSRDYDTGSRHHGPYQFALAVTEAYPLPLPNAKFTRDPADAAAKRARADVTLAANPAALAALQSLVDEFQPILNKLGQDVPALNIRLAALAAAPQQRPLLAGRPFPDVPKNHWAYQAVEILRTSGIVAGYPAGTFRTNGTP